MAAAVDAPRKSAATFVKIRYRIPRWWPPLDDWLNADVRAPIRRIDLILSVFGFICCAYYASLFEVWWQGWLFGLAGYAMAIAFGLVLRSLHDR